MNTYISKGKLIAGIIAFVLPVTVYAASLLYQAAPPTIKWNKNAVQELTLTTNATLTFSGGKVGERYTLVVLQDAVGNRTISWPTDVQWPGGVTPDLTGSANSTDVFEFLFDGTRYLGSVIKNYRAIPPTTGLNAGLVHYWKLDESSGDALDAVGNMTMLNVNATPYISAKINNGIDVEHNNTGFLRTSEDVSNTSLTSYTTCLWYAPESRPGEGAAFSLWTSYDTPGTFDVLDVNPTDGDPQLWFRHFLPSVDSVIVEYPVDLPNGVFSHLCMTWDGEVTTLYVNGDQAGTPRTATSIRTNTETAGTTIGGQSISESSVFNVADGIIDEVGFWTRALSASEVAGLYNNGAGDSYPF